MNGALIEGSVHPSEQSDPDPFAHQEFDKEMQEAEPEGKIINDIFDADPNPFDDLDVGLGEDASIHPLSIKGGEEMKPDGFGGGGD